MTKLNEPAKPASENPTVALTAGLRIEGVKPEDARKAYRLWGRACAAVTAQLQHDFGAQINVVISPELPL